MSINQHEHGGTTDERWLDQWDGERPAEPAVFIIDTATFDRHGTRWGRWLDPTQEPADVRRDIEDCVGIEFTEAGHWAVIDQVGLGDAMIPEQLSIDALVRIARQRRGDHR